MSFSLSIQAGDLKLWYKQPAGTWVEALPVGNSRMGAMVYGGTAREELQLNDETMWGQQARAGCCRGRRTKTESCWN